jgi:hypothetical protein
MGATYAALTWKQRATNMSQQPKFNLNQYKIESLAHDYGDALRVGLSQPNVMSGEKADEFLEECHPLSLITAEGTLGQMKQRVQQTGHL